MKTKLKKDLEEQAHAYLNNLNSLVATDEQDKNNLNAFVKLAELIQKDDENKISKEKVSKELSLKEQEISLKERELSLKEREINKEIKSQKLKKIEIIGGFIIGGATIGFKIYSLIKFKQMGNMALIAEYKDNLIIPRSYKDAMSNINSLIK